MLTHLHCKLLVKIQSNSFFNLLTIGSIVSTLNIFLRLKKQSSTRIIMAKVISQETFDDVVKENILEFSMSVEEARSESIQQFEAQGINLGNIIKDFSINEESGLPILTETINKLKSSLDSKIDKEEMLACLNVFKSECDKSVPHRVFAAIKCSLEVLLHLINIELSATVLEDFQVSKTIIIIHFILISYLNPF